MASALQRAKAALETLSTVLVIAAACAMLWAIFVREPAGATPPASVEDANGTIARTHLTNSMGQGSIAIVEFSDFQCPFCARHAQETIPLLKQKLEGSARYFVINLPLGIHQQAMPAAEAAECAAEQGKYWEMHDLLFANQRDLATAKFADYARTLGLDTTRFESCLATDSGLTKVTADRDLARRLSANATPTIFLG